MTPNSNSSNSRHPSNNSRHPTIAVFLGAGGVGKTTCSIGYGIAAARQGWRVAVLSIDPAKRLAAALGIPLHGELKEIPLGREVKGSFAAAILDQKAVFDQMCRRFAPDPETYQRILDNKLYQAISARLSGSLEYMALARLQELVEEGRHDLIVLDTPPDAQALDFLNRPNVLENFMENKVMTWLIKPFFLASKLGVGRLISFGERLMGGIAKVTGVQSLQVIAEFLLLMQQVITGFHRAGSATRETLSAPETRFILTARLQPAAVRTAALFIRELGLLGYQLDEVICNRGLPRFIVEGLAHLEQYHNTTALPPALQRLQQRAVEERQQQDLLTAELKSQVRVMNLAETSAPMGIDDLLRFSDGLMSLIPQRGS